MPTTLHPEAAEQLHSGANEDFVFIRAGPEKELSGNEQAETGQSVPIRNEDVNQAGKKDGFSTELRNETNNGDSEQNLSDEARSASAAKETGRQENRGAANSGELPWRVAPGDENEKRKAIVFAGNLLVRAGPGMNYKPVGSLQKNTSVTILSFQNDWAEIAFQNGTAWINSRYVRFSESTDTMRQNADANKIEGAGEKKPENRASALSKGIIQAPALNVRVSASMSGKIIGTVSRGEVFAILEEQNGWMKIEFEENCFGWVSGVYVGSLREIKDQKEAGEQSRQKTNRKKSFGTILFDGTRIREHPHVQSRILQKANAGDIFPVVKTIGNWAEILLKDGQKAYVAGWLIDDAGTTPAVKEKEKGRSLSGKVIIIDPGHGGKDSGATGTGGSEEKSLTLNTALILYDKLRAEGARVILTRSSDIYIPLSSRVKLSHVHKADAFISIHYDSAAMANAGGVTTYYYHVHQKPLAVHIQDALQKHINLQNRGVRFGDYYVIRENRQVSVLLELGYLSNPHEEAYISTRSYQEKVSEAIVAGLDNYFSL